MIRFSLKIHYKNLNFFSLKHHLYDRNRETSLEKILFEKSKNNIWKISSWIIICEWPEMKIKIYEEWKWNLFHKYTKSVVVFEEWETGCKLQRQWSKSETCSGHKVCEILRAETFLFWHQTFMISLTNLIWICWLAMEEIVWLLPSKLFGFFLPFLCSFFLILFYFCCRFKDK